MQGEKHAVSRDMGSSRVASQGKGMPPELGSMHEQTEKDLCAEMNSTGSIR